MQLIISFALLRQVPGHHHKNSALKFHISKDLLGATVFPCKTTDVRSQPLPLISTYKPYTKSMYAALLFFQEN